jgi:hypothetical protein
MITAENIVDSMVDGFMSNTKFQARIRAFIHHAATEEEACSFVIATDIASIVTLYREKIDIIIAEMTDKTEIKSSIKKRDNIINDVSRICRDALDYTIVCTSRKKGEYTAIVCLPKVPRAPSASYVTPDPNPFMAAPLPCSERHFDPALHCEIPLTDSDYAEVAIKSLARGSDFPNRMIYLPTGKSATPEFICSVSALFGVGLEELAKHIVTILRKS